MPDFSMSEQKLNSAQVGAGFEHVSGKRVPQRMRTNILLNPGSASGAFTSVIDCLGSKVFPC